MSLGAIGSISRRDAELMSYVNIGAGSTAQRVEATIGSQANVYVILCGIESGTSTVVPLLCTADGYLLTTATS